MPFQFWVVHESWHPAYKGTWAHSKWMPRIQPTHKISQIPCTSHLFLPCWDYNYMGQRTSFSRIGETEVMAINTRSRLAGVGRAEGVLGPKPVWENNPRGPACSLISSWTHKKTETQRGRDSSKATGWWGLEVRLGYNLVVLRRGCSSCRLLPTFTRSFHLALRGRTGLALFGQEWDIMI